MSCLPTDRWGSSAKIKYRISTRRGNGSSAYMASHQGLSYFYKMIDVHKWLLDHGFEHFFDLFEENEIDGEVLFDLTDGDLKELGLALGPRVRDLVVDIVSRKR